MRTNWQKINDAVRGALEQITLVEMAQPGMGQRSPGPAPEHELVPLRSRAASGGGSL